MDKILEIILVTIIFANVFLVIIGKDIRRVKPFRFSWFLGGVILLVLFFLKIKDSLIEYIIISILVLLFSIGIKFSILGTVFLQKNKTLDNKQTYVKCLITNTLVYILLLFLILLTLNIIKNILFNSTF